MNRNQLYEFAEDTVACLGDPHLGRKFRAGVPTDRIGQREKMVWDDFKESLMDHIPSIHVCMGDLFDKANVDYQTIFLAYDAYREAAETHPTKQFFIIMGNHDMSRNTERMSAFGIFGYMVDHLVNVTVVNEPKHWNGFGFIPYHPFRTSAEMIQKYREEFGTLDTYAVFGHWDIDTFNSEMPHNIFPFADIATLPHCFQAFTGHVHLPETRDYDGLELVVTGSMQPYSFAEDPKGEMYLTIALADLYKHDARDLKNKCVRVILADGEQLPEIDCLQLIGKRLGDPDVEEDIDVEMAVFDMQGLMREEMEKAGVTSPKVQQFIFGEYDRLRAEEA